MALYKYTLLFRKLHIFSLSKHPLYFSTVSQFVIENILDTPAEAGPIMAPLCFSKTFAFVVCIAMLPDESNDMLTDHVNHPIKNADIL